MHFYGLTHRETLDLRTDTFWCLHKNIDRINAEQDIRLAYVMVHMGDQKGVQDLMIELRKRMGTVVEMDEAKVAIQSAKLDSTGLKDLKMMGNIGR
jgi:hypothetical protein